MTPEQKMRKLILMQAQSAPIQIDEMGFPKQPQGGSSVNTQALNEFRPKANAVLDGVVQGASFGLQDEFAGVNNAVFGGRAPGATMGERYVSGRDDQRATNQSSQANEPLAYGGGQVAGAIAPALLAGPLASGKNAVSTGLRGAGIGGLEGALHGAGGADGRGVANQAAKGALAGAAVGLAAPLAVGAVSKAKGMVSGLGESAFNIGNPNKANEAISRLIQQSKKTPDGIGQEVTRAAKQGQPEFRLMDALGLTGQRAASGLARKGGESGEKIAEYLMRRQGDQGDRVGGFVEDAFNVRGTTAARTTDSLKQARTEQANTAYDAARGNAAPVDVRSAVDVIDQRIGGMEGSNVNGDAIDSKLAGYRNRLAAKPAPNGEISRELSDFDRVLGVKQSIQDDIGAAIRAGRNNEARELGKLAQELDGALENSSDMYRTANDGFREASGVIDAVEKGAGMSGRGRGADTTNSFQSMSPNQQGAARIGYGDSLLEKLEKVTSPTSNRAKSLQSTKREMEADAIAKNAPDYREKLARESTMWETQNRALGGSRTADNLTDQEAMSSLAGGTLDAAKSAGNFQLGDAAAKIAATLGPIARGQSDATRMLIARALMSSDPQKALAPMLRQAKFSDSKKRMVEALTRNLSRDSASEVISGQ